MVFQRSMSDNKSLQVSRILLSILADLNNFVVWIVFSRPLILKFSSPLTKPLVTVLSAPITSSFPVTFMFHSFFPLSTRCNPIQVTVPNVVRWILHILLWHWLGDYHMHFQVVCLSISPVPTLCLKDSQMGNDTSHS